MMELKDKADLLIAKSGQLFRREVENRFPFDQELSLIRAVEGAKDVQQCTFTRPGATHDANDFSFSNTQIDPFEYFQTSVGFANILCFDHVLSIL